MKQLVSILILLPLLASASYFVNNGSGLPFLSKSYGVRPAGMAGAFTGLADDINTLQFNPAGLGTLDNNQLLFSHDQNVAEINTEYIVFTHPAFDGNMGYSFMFHYTPDLKEIAQGKETGNSFSWRNYSVSLSYGRNIWKWIYFGMNFKHAYGYNLNIPYNAATLDAGLLFIYDLEPFVPNLTYSGLGLSVMNLFPDISYPFKADRMDRKFRLGTGFRYMNIMSLAIDLENSIDKSHTFRFGYEIFPISFLALRVGYVQNGFTESSWDNLTLGVGVGNTLRDGTLAFDISAEMKQSVGRVFEFSLHWVFNRPYHFTSLEAKISREKMIAQEKIEAEKRREEAVQRRLDSQREVPAKEPTSETEEKTTTPPDGSTDSTEQTTETPESQTETTQTNR